MSAQAAAPSAEAFLAALGANRSDAEREKYRRYFKLGEGEYGEGDRFIGVRMGTVFALAKAHVQMDLAGIETLLESDIHEARAGALSIMGKQYALRRTAEERREALAGLYLRRHDRVNNWDLVDLGCLYVLGPHLVGRPKRVLHELARSDDLWERRTALYACQASIRRGDMDDAFAICEHLLADRHDLTQKAVGMTLRSTGTDRPRLLGFLDRHAATMGRTALRTAIEKLAPETRAHYMGLKPES